MAIKKIEIINKSQPEAAPIWKLVKNSRMPIIKLRARGNHFSKTQRP